MPQAQNKTQKTTLKPREFISSLDDEQKKKDSLRLLKLMKDITGEKPVMWGSAIIGFGDYHYKYESGREGDFFITGFSPRKQNLTVYIMPGYEFPNMQSLLKKLGPHKTGKSCLYIKKLDDIDVDVLSKIIDTGYKKMKSLYKV